EHAIVPVRTRRGRVQSLDVVGPVCESTDVLARGRRLVLPEPGALLAIRGAGAYGMSMASTYNGRPRPAEVMVSGRTARVIRRGERVEALWGGGVAGGWGGRRHEAPGIDARAGHAVPWRSAGRGRVPGAGAPAARRRNRGPGALRDHRRGGDHDRRGE